MPPKTEGSDMEGDGDVSGIETGSNSSQAHGTSDDEANEMSDDSSEMDSAEVERRRSEYLDFISNLERQFAQIREQYYIERVHQIETQLEEVRNERSDEYLQPLKELEKVFKERISVAEVLRKFRMENIEHKFISEERSALQNLKSEKMLLYDDIKEDLTERIRRLEEDRHNVDITWSDWGTDKRVSKVRGPGRKKAVTVNGPYVVYMLRDEDILADWHLIRKALKRAPNHSTSAT